MFNKETDIIKLDWVYRIRIENSINGVPTSYIVKALKPIDNKHKPKEVTSVILMGNRVGNSVWFGVDEIIEECCHINDFADEFPQYLI